MAIKGKSYQGPDPQYVQLLEDLVTEMARKLRDMEDRVRILERNR